jgi:hypothetical protein
MIDRELQNAQIFILSFLPFIVFVIVLYTRLSCLLSTDKIHATYCTVIMNIKVSFGKVSFQQ